MAPHSSTLAWKIPWVEEPGRLQSMESQRVRQDWVTSLSLFTFMHWRRKWQPTPVFLPGESQGWGSLVGCCIWGLTESNTTEVTAFSIGWTLGVGDGQGGLACWGSWGHKELDTTEQLNWTELREVCLTIENRLMVAKGEKRWERERLWMWD